MEAVIVLGNHAEQLRQLKQQAERFQKRRFEIVYDDYKWRFEQWHGTMELRSALKLAPLVEPEPPLKPFCIFDEERWMFIEMDGPERFERLMPPPPPEPPPPVKSKLGRPWPGRPDICMAVPGETAPIGSTLEFGGKTWVLIGYPWDAKLPYYWRVQQSAAVAASSQSSARKR